MPCPTRLHAILVIETAGDDPRVHEQASTAQASTARADTAKVDTTGVHPAQVTPQSQTPWQVERDGHVIGGYAVGGLGRRQEVPYFPYER